MASRRFSPFWVIFFINAASISLAKSHGQHEETRSVGGGRILLGFKETQKGSNITFACSPSGPCVSCNSSEKRKEKYRCSETGYRIPFKCKELKGEEEKANLDDVDSTKPHDSPPAKVKSQSYKTYRSCVPSAHEDKISLLGFEAFMLGLLLISGSAIYFKKKQTLPMLGVSNGRSQSNSRF